jgi:hypothetical protein|tara:strand:+ start:305 stop:508 length:204 start_codon:yes stop_codon:yes gene_type:complete
MAHLIQLTDQNTNQEILFNLDTVVSIERAAGQTVITTRWGRQQVQESLDYILVKAKENSVTVAAGDI